MYVRRVLSVYSSCTVKYCTERTILRILKNITTTVPYHILFVSFYFLEEVECFISMIIMKFVISSSVLLLVCKEIKAFVPWKQAICQLQSGTCKNVVNVIGNVRHDVDRKLSHKFEPSAILATKEEEEVVGSSSDSSSMEDGERSIRPLHQNWWPLTVTTALKKDRPNAVELLNQKLVLFWSESESSWKCLDDRCSHRFAPLSEGRIVPSNKDDASTHLECAYHGWQFDGNGHCQKVPQSKSSAACGGCVTSYPLQVMGTMIFVWADPDSYQSLGKSIHIPTFPLLQQKASEWEQAETTQVFMRDLPYGMEILAENLLDLAHLPFSHHGVGPLDREMGTELSFKMLSNSQKSSDQPYFEAALENAATTDPMAIKNPMAGPNYKLNLGFYSPCHVRYTRQLMPGKFYYVALYLCPISNAKSRVFLLNLSNLTPPNPPVTNTKYRRLFNKFIPSFQPILSPTAKLHLGSHKIFDGDGIFLHKQGDRMQRSNLSYKDYSTPTSSDLLVNAFRRYLNIVCKTTRALGLDNMVDAVMPPVGQGYNDNLPRSLMLDRYESHTKHCKDCMASLQAAQATKKRLKILQTALIGASGASAVTFITSLILRIFITSNPLSWLLRLSALTTTSCIGGCLSISKKLPQLENFIQQFFFEDYIHADKH